MTGLGGERRVFINAVSTVIQIGVNASILFLLYRFLFHSIGIQRIGIWSVVFASTAVASVARGGVAAGVTKYTARYLALNEGKKVLDLIQTTTLFLALVVAVFTLAIYPFSRWVLAFAMPPASLPEAYAVLPFALASLWITAVGEVFKAALDGCQLIVRRNCALMLAAVAFLSLSYFLVPRYGLRGLAYAHVSQAALMAVLGWLFLKVEIRALPLVPLRWSRSVFREVIGYTLNFQVIFIAESLFDPITRFFLARYAGLSMTGFYEMAIKMVFILRWLVVSTAQVLVPVAARLKERDPGSLGSLYTVAYNGVSFIAFPLFSLAAISTPLISRLWIGYCDPLFILFSLVLIFATLFNIMSTPAAVMNAGTGELTGNTAGTVLTTTTGIALAIVGGIMFGGIGTVLGVGLATIAGSAATYLWYHFSNGLSFRQLVPEENKTLLWISVSSLCIFFALYELYPFWSSHMAEYLFSFVIPISLLMAYRMWVHPARVRIMRLASGSLPMKENGHGPGMVIL